jgi:NADH:ubiquinone oxidoreductase subunit 5 (subunit L)/multisubunit Na+/H+ antiporter MnhA subunit
VWPELEVALPSLSVAAVGLGVGWWFYGRRGVVVNTRIYKQRFHLIYGALERKLFFDSIYSSVIIRPYRALADVLAVFDRKGLDGAVNLAVAAWSRASVHAWRIDDAAIDGVVNGVARADIELTEHLETFDLSFVDRIVDLLGHGVFRAGALRKIHTGNVQTYLTAFTVAAIAVVLIFAR